GRFLVFHRSGSLHRMEDSDAKLEAAGPVEATGHGYRRDRLRDHRPALSGIAESGPKELATCPSTMITRDSGYIGPESFVIMPAPWRRPAAPAPRAAGYSRMPVASRDANGAGWGEPPSGALRNRKVELARLLDRAH